MRINNAEKLAQSIIEGLQDRKAVDIVKIDLRKIDGAVSKFFIVCNGTSSTHTMAVSDSVEEYVRQDIGEKVWRKQGTENAFWIILDYGDVVVHIFQEEYRDYYQLESLWGDAEITKID
ncbi:MAG: ribosome silencing factor [Marinifilaceae bacterium]|jgi:ribosome-associated protein|nr:ribosome silencing factor [Marinifilaceae bacterium]